MKYLVFRVYDILLSKPVTGEVLIFLGNLTTKWRKNLQYIFFTYFKVRPWLNENTINSHLSYLSSTNFDDEHLDVKALVHVAFHFDKGRIAYLTEAVEQVDRLQFNEKEIVVDTNSENTEKLLAKNPLPCKINVARHLSHPFLLTWVHRKDMRERLNHFDIFIYIEDDIYIPAGTVSRWYNEKQKLKKYGFLPGFLRVEHNRQGKLVSSDFESVVSRENVVEIEGALYLATPFPYQACWMYDKETMIEFLESEAYENGWEEFVKLNYIRENAAIGLTYESPPNGYSSRHLLALTDEGVVSQETFVFHVPSNYGRKIRNHPAKLGTVLVEDLIASDI